MPFRKILRRSALLFVLLSAIACGKSDAITEQLTPDALFERAIAELHDRDWTTAIELFERFTIQYPTHPRLQEARYRTAEAYFGKKEYITAANEFDRLANDYPAGPYADDSRFKVCESYYKLSPKPPLDQQYTRAALDHCQSMLTYYPSSDHAPRAQEIITQMRDKLAEKEFRNAEHYFKRNAYDSAIIYYDLVLREYPQAGAAPRALMRLYETYQILDYREEAEAARERLLKEYPTSPEAQQLQARTASS